MSPPLTNDLLLRALERQPVPRTPVWMMRQAGRCLPSYLKLRADRSFLQLCKNPELATEVTLLPVQELRVDAAILFADIVGFTTRAERQSPRQVVEELNRYFAFIDPVLEAHDGILDKRIGDGIMVVFLRREGESAPEMQRRSLRCALALLRAVQTHNPEGETLGIAPLQIRVGIAAGPTIQGNIGSEAQIEYTVIGDTVNLSSRLEAEAQPGHLLMTRQVYDACKDEDLRDTRVTRRETMQLRGRDQMQETIEVTTTDALPSAALP